MTDTLEWAYWLRAVWEARTTVNEWYAVEDGPSLGMDAVDFFNLWMGDLVHVGRHYDAD